jgi:uncharacterized protein YegJ (DUF2314 family)
MYRALVLGMFALAASGAGCRKDPGDRIERSGEPEFLLSRVNDTEMEAAMRRAHETLPQFAGALAGDKGGRKLFAIKKAYSDGKKTEFIWLNDVVESGERFEATVNNSPVWLSNVKEGSRVAVPKDEVVDWMYVDNGTLVGGFTLRVLFFRETAEKQRELERTFGFKVPQLKACDARPRVRRRFGVLEE